MQKNGWHTEKHALCNFLKERLLKGRDQITYGELIQKNLPAFFRSFLKSQVKRYFDKENPVRIEKKSRYDFHSEEMQQELTQLREVIQRATIFAADEISDAIDKTISLQIDYFVKPRKTLERVFFKSKDSRSQKEVLQAILGIADNRRYIQQLIATIKANSSPIITKIQFSRLDQEVQTEVYQQDPVAVFIEDLSVLLEFLGVVQNNKVQKLKVALLPEMLAERSLNELAELIERKFSYSDEEQLTIQEIESVLKSKPQPLTNNEPLEGTRKAQKASSSDWQEEIFCNNDSDMHPFLNLSDKSESQPERDKMDKKVPNVGNKVFFASGGSQTIGAREIGSLDRKEKEAPEIKKPRIIYKGEEKGYPTKTGFHGRQSDANENLVIDRKMIENQPDGPIPSLSTIVDPRSRKILIRKVFKKNEVAYNAFMEKIEATLTWKEAKVMIDEELFKRNVEPFSREAIRLGDIIFSRYFPKKQ